MFQTEFCQLDDLPIDTLLFTGLMKNKTNNDQTQNDDDEILNVLCHDNSQECSVVIVPWISNRDVVFLPPKRKPPCGGSLF
jgi:hypothetical protein